MDRIDRRTARHATGRSTEDEHDLDAGSVADARSRSRDSLLLVAQVRVGDEARSYEARVRNLSEGGLMIELDKLLEIGTPVHVDLRGIDEISGKVAWCTEGRIGIALDTSIDPMKARKPVGKGPVGKGPVGKSGAGVSPAYAKVPSSPGRRSS